MAKTIQINLLQAAHMLGKDFQKGIHTIEAEAKNTPIYKLLAINKLVQEVVDPAVVEAQTNKKIAGLEEALKAEKEVTKELKDEIKKLKK